MQHLQPDDILTRITRYNLIRSQRLVYIDIHEALYGRLAARFVAVPNLINIIAKQEYQGVGETESEAAGKLPRQDFRMYKSEDLFRANREKIYEVNRNFVGRRHPVFNEDHPSLIDRSAWRLAEYPDCPFSRPITLEIRGR